MEVNWAKTERAYLALTFQPSVACIKNKLLSTKAISLCINAKTEISQNAWQQQGKGSNVHIFPKKGKAMGTIICDEDDAFLTLEKERSFTRSFRTER